MSPWAEIILAILDCISFMFVTPMVLGEEKLKGLLIKFEKVHWWLRSVYFNRDVPPFATPSFIMFLIVNIVLTILALSGIVVFPSYKVIPITLATSIIPGLIVMTYWGVLHLAKKFGISRTLAMIGAIAFLCGRMIIVTSAAIRLS